MTFDPSLPFPRYNGLTDEFYRAAAGKGNTVIDCLAQFLIWTTPAAKRIMVLYAYDSRSNRRQ